MVASPLFSTCIYHKQATLLWFPDYCYTGTKKMTCIHDRKQLSQKNIQRGKITTQTDIFIKA